MAGYQDFAYFYDDFNVEANYESLHAFVRDTFLRHSLTEGIVADLGCGTGELTLRLAFDGYDMIAVDASEDMLAILNDKKSEQERQNILLLHQDLTQLDLYGTIRGAVSTFDTFNHIGPFDRLDAAIAKVGLFMEKDGIFIFDVNTPYKHQFVLGDNEFTLEDEDAVCVWKNHFDETHQRTQMDICIRYADEPQPYQESFFEYSYPLEQLKNSCIRHGFEILDILDGERFLPLAADSQRAIFIGKKIIQCQS